MAVALCSKQAFLQEALLLSDMLSQELLEVSLVSQWANQFGGQAKGGRVELR